MDSICVIVLLKGSFFDLKTKEMMLYEFSCSAWEPDLWNCPYKSPLIWGWTVRGLVTLPTSAFEVRVFCNSWHQNKDKCLSNHWLFSHQKHTTFSSFLPFISFFFLSFISGYLQLSACSNIKAWSLLTLACGNTSLTIHLYSSLPSIFPSEVSNLTQMHIFLQ